MTSVSSRRTLLSGATAVIMGGGITAGAAASVADLAEQPDADLIAACADYLRIQHAFEAIVVADNVENDDPRLSMLDPLSALEERIITLTATTAEGHLARARCMAFWYLPSHRIAQDDPDDTMENRFQAALYRDLIAQERPEARAGRA